MRYIFACIIATVLAVIGAAPAAAQAAPIPTITGATVLSDTSARLSWSKAGAATGYDVRLNTGSTTRLGSGARSYTWNNLQPCTTYTLGVRSVGKRGGVSAFATRTIKTTGCTPPPPTDTDGDGVPDSTDQCPNQAGPASNNGCPVPPPPPTDTDGDGVPDSTDQCPNQAGPASNNGCPVVEPPPGPTPTLREQDGGRDWMVNHGMPKFPIAAWGTYNHYEAVNRDLDADFGVNTYIWAADSGAVPAIRTDGRFKVIQDYGNLANIGSETVGISLGDEQDMMSPDGSCPSESNQRKQSVGAAANGRFWFNNFGKGLALPPGDAGYDDPAGSHNWWSTTAEANCLANTVDFVTNDFYWFTDPFDGPANRHGFRYGKNIEYLRRAAMSDGVAQPLATFIEGGWPFSESAANGGRAIQPAELRSAVWHSIIKGARAVLYFNHSFGGPCISHHGLTRGECYPENRTAGKAVNQQIQSLADVLNSPSVTSEFTTTGDVERTVRWDGSNFYVIAGARTGAANMQFDMPCVGNATATVVGENRSIPVANGRFSDAFADKNAVHIYRLDGGNSCGLT